MNTREKLKGLLLQSILTYAEEEDLDFEVTDSTLLVGPGSSINSLGLVSILVNFEAALNESFHTDIVLASEKAMSMERSPFRSVERLLDYSESLLREAGKG